MALFRKKKGGDLKDDDDRSFAVALRLELVAKRLALINHELEKRLGDEADELDEGGAGHDPVA